MQIKANMKYVLFLFYTRRKHIMHTTLYQYFAGFFHETVYPVDLFISKHMEHSFLQLYSFSLCGCSLSISSSVIVIILCPYKE